MAYDFSECVESHAFETYDMFFKASGEELKKSHAPDIAVKYYTRSDLYFVDSLTLCCDYVGGQKFIRCVCENTRDDEAEHCKTMRACQTLGSLRSSHSIRDDEDCNEESGCGVPEEAHCEDS
ncbi:unnamed protein product [Eruca vesicaria subsp. sativa]|uniref:Ubiquinol oxidase n=1 Tax=Eruca vesicaria subsp. sativa TaxID=29727 RepID=A0ABC8IS03_ERUVS|nr:unnamed protein product [Eruca vesicaria subsp. sativa]